MRDLLHGSAPTIVHASRRTGSRYRPDIDGLRAVALTLVLLYHLNPSLAPSGFVGVDVFFVISGFVVTSSILDAPANGPWESVARFWRRRILRIVPALMFMVLVSAVALAMFRVPFPLPNYQGEFRTGIAALVGLGNQYLYRGSADYFTGADTVNPFVHTWSLGVEEQFYLIFAILFIGVIGLIKYSPVRVRTSIAVMALLGAFSYIAFLTTASRNASLVYYLIPFRFWEIAAGSLLAYLTGVFPGSGDKTFGIWTGLIQLFAAAWLTWAVWMDGTHGFPSRQISASAGAAVLLIAAGRPANVVSRILSNRIIVHIGLCSYSLYLWHYPVLQLWRIEIGLHHLPEYLTALCIIAAASALSYWGIERTFRYSRASFPRVMLPIILLSLAGTAGLAGLLQEHPGAIYVGSPQLWDTEWGPPADLAFLRSTEGTVEAACAFNGDGLGIKDGRPLPSGLPNQCLSTVGDNRRPGVMLLAMGDSHAMADWAMDAFGDNSGAYRLATLVHLGCIPDGWETQRPSCGHYWKLVPLVMSQVLHRGDSLLLSILWPVDSQTRILETVHSMSGIAQTARRLGVEVLIEAPQPTFERPAYLCTKEWYRWDYDGCTANRSEIESRRAFVMDRLRDMVRQEGNVRIWDPLPLLCSGSVCSQFSEGKPVFRDSDHLAFREAASLGPSFLAFWRERPEQEAPDVAR
jgi:peptidoglycan/LPS O-acetylase OafA/YrhL